MKITMTSEELAMLLEVSPKTLRNIVTKGNLEERILAKGFELHDSYKEGRNNIYELDKIVTETWNVIQAKHNIRKSSKSKHDTYSKTRILEMDKSRKQVIKDSETNICYSTAKKYDEILLEEKIMDKNEYVYFQVDMTTDRFTPISEYEYKTFWMDNRELKTRLNEYKNKLSKYEISEEAYDYLVGKTYESFGKENGVIAIKFMTYKQAENTMRILNELNNL